MKAAVLGWGSLLWEEYLVEPNPPKEPDNVLYIMADWRPGGPQLPIEFSRVSSKRNGALTLVIDKTNGESNPTSFAESSYTNLSHAFTNLCRREGGIKAKDVGYVNRNNGKSRSKVLPVDTLLDWAKRNNFEAVIWTDLDSNFGDVNKSAYLNKNSAFLQPNGSKMQFTVDNAMQYLHDLKEEGAIKAREYIKKAPVGVNTPLRRRLHGAYWLDSTVLCSKSTLSISDKQTLSETSPGRRG